MKRLILCILFVLILGVMPVYADTASTNTSFKMENRIYYTIRVSDVLYDSLGNLQETRVRCEDTYLSGEPYRYEALEINGYSSIDIITVSGTANENIEITFKYQADKQEKVRGKEHTYTLRVRDILYEMDGTLVRDTVRTVQTELSRGYVYQFNALTYKSSYKVFHNSYINGKLESREETKEYDSYKVVGSSTIQGSIKKDLDIIFLYVRCDINGNLPDVIPNLRIPGNMADGSYISSLQTGDDFCWKKYVLLLILSTGVVVIVKKQKIF